MKFSKTQSYEIPSELAVANEFEKLSCMTDFEFSFLFELIKEKRPNTVVEIGVAAGGTTCRILKTLDFLGLKDTKVVSIDLYEETLNDPSKKNGYTVDYLDNKFKRNWELKLGHTCAYYLDEIGGGIDFFIVDTAHILPGEVLDILAILPYCSSNAYIVLHDTNLHELFNENNVFNASNDTVATCVALSSTVGEKIVCLNPKGELANIGAIKVNKYTNQFVDNLFCSLMLTWRYLPDVVVIDEYRELYRRFYPNYLVFFDELIKQKEKDFKQRIFNIFKQGQNLVIWGAGISGKSFLDRVSCLNVNEGDELKYDDFLKNIVFVDIDKNKQREMFCGKAVKPPEYIKTQKNIVIKIAIFGGEKIEDNKCFALQSGLNWKNVWS